MPPLKDLWLAPDATGWYAFYPDHGPAYLLHDDLFSEWLEGHAFDRFREDAEEFIREAAMADTHSSDRDPGAVDPWEDR